MLKEKPTHTVYLQKVQYGYWGQTPYNDIIKKIKVTAKDEEAADYMAKRHPSIAKYMYKRLRNGDSVTYKTIKIEAHNKTSTGT